MKRALIASILGIAASVAQSYGQGYIAFKSYELAGPSSNIPAYSAVTFGGQNVGANWNADLLYSLNGGATFSPAAGSLTGFYPGSVTGGSPLTDGAGTFVGATVVIPGYASGAVQFIVEAFDGASFGTSAHAGQSAVFTIPSLQTNNLLVPGDILNLDTNFVPQGFQSFIVPVPEPATFGLVGLSAAAMLIFRRRK